MTAFPEPASSDDLRSLLLSYLDFFRTQVRTKTCDLTRTQLQRSVVPSGWTPGGLINHLTFMERRWFEWGFIGADIAQPWGDADGNGWLTPDEDAEPLLARLVAQGERTRAIVEAHGLDQRARTGGRFMDEADAPHLQWILLHVVQEYARHMGHLDIARELADAEVRER